MIQVVLLVQSVSARGIFDVPPQLQGTKHIVQGRARALSIFRPELHCDDWLNVSAPGTTEATSLLLIQRIQLYRVFAQDHAGQLDSPLARDLAIVDHAG